MNHTPEYIAACKALSSEPGLCDCGAEKEPIAMTPITETTISFGKRYACPFCEVRLIDRPDEEFWTVILRSEIDPAYGWLPAKYRQAGARAGFGFSSHNHDFVDPQRYPVVDGFVWACDPHLFFKTDEPAHMAAELRAMIEGGADAKHERAEVGIRRSLKASEKFRPGIFEVLDKRNVAVGDFIVDRRYHEMLMSIFPNAVPACAAKVGISRDPIVYRVDGVAVAAVMPVHFGPNGKTDYIAAKQAACSARN